MSRRELVKGGIYLTGFPAKALFRQSSCTSQHELEAEQMAARREYVAMHGVTQENRGPKLVCLNTFLWAQLATGGAATRRCDIWHSRRRCTRAYAPFRPNESMLYSRSCVNPAGRSPVHDSQHLVRWSRRSRLIRSRR